MGGFSAGAMMTNFLMCHASQIFCSSAPIGAGLSHTCYMEGGPKIKRSMMFQVGKNDAIVNRHNKVAPELHAGLKRAYGVTKGTKLKKGDGVDWTRYHAKNGLTLEFASYDF